jgi:1-acyl-sn-glycerol-3-phosphate acyltransferase
MREFKTYIEVEITVKYGWDKGERGYRDSMGVPEEPDIPAHVEDLEIIYPEELDKEIMEELEKEAEEHYRECLDEDKLQRQLQKKGDKYE